MRDIKGFDQITMTKNPGHDRFLSFEAVMVMVHGQGKKVPKSRVQRIYSMIMNNYLMSTI